jgi:hypothetical protein
MMPLRERESERKDFEEGREVRMQMTFIYSKVTLNPCVSQLAKVKFSTQSSFCKRNTGRYHEVNVMKKISSQTKYFSSLNDTAALIKVVFQG